MHLFSLKLIAYSLQGRPQATSHKPQARQGFTLIELMVVLAIVVIISLLILVSASRFNSSILLRSLAYEVGLAIREAQLYGVAVKGAPPVNGNSPLVQCVYGGTSSIFCAPYGVDLKKNVNVITIFADTDAPPDGIYQPSEPVADQFKAQYGFSISNFCAGDGVSTYNCANGTPPSSQLTGSCAPSSCDTLSQLDITFARPSPNAAITASFSTAGTPPSSAYTQALIIVSSPAGCKRSIFVSSTGQIVITPTSGSGSC